MSLQDEHLEYSISHVRINIWSTPDVTSESTSGVLHMSLLESIISRDNVTTCVRLKGDHLSHVTV